MGLPSGTLWAINDIDVTKENGFTDTPYTYEKSFFSWGNVDGHNPTSENSFSPWDWGSVNAEAPYFEGQVYGDTPGNTQEGDIEVGEEHDAARACLGAPWRMPTSAEFVELLDNIIFIDVDGTEIDPGQVDKRVTMNGIVGIYIQSQINGARLFFACSGNGNGTNLLNRGSRVYYWSSTWINERSARSMRVYNGGVNARIDGIRNYGFAIRAVMNR